MVMFAVGKKIAKPKNWGVLSVKAHEKSRGKLSIESKMPVRNRDDLSIAYTPGVAQVCKEIERDAKLAYKLTSAKRTVAVITDGSAVLGLGNIGADASLPVMEGKAVLFKKFADIDAFPIALSTQNTDEIVATVERIAPSFGGINLEDISAPRCFEIEERLKKSLKIPVFHDDQHGTAIVILAALTNALKVRKMKKSDAKIVLVGAGSAGIATLKLLTAAGFPRVFLIDTKGIVSDCRTDLNDQKKKMLECCAVREVCGVLENALLGANIFIGVSKGGVLTEELFTKMAPNPIIFAMANPTPEIDPSLARKLGASIIATGRSDYPNQINNVLAFPGIFKGVFDIGASQITEKMKLAAANALANMVRKPTREKIIPGPFEKGVVETVARSVAKSA